MALSNTPSRDDLDVDGLEVARISKLVSKWMVSKTMARPSEKVAHADNAQSHPTDERTREEHCSVALTNTPSRDDLDVEDLKVTRISKWRVSRSGRLDT